MNVDILERIVGAIADGSQGDLDSLARKVVGAERESGHGRLADELDEYDFIARSRGRQYLAHVWCQPRPFRQPAQRRPCNSRGFCDVGSAAGRKV